MDNWTTDDVFVCGVESSICGICERKNCDGSCCGEVALCDLCGQGWSATPCRSVR